MVVFNKCNGCSTLLEIGRKYCSYECGAYHYAENYRKKKSKKQLEQMKRNLEPLNYLRLNSSEAAYKRAIKLL